MAALAAAAAEAASTAAVASFAAAVACLATTRARWRRAWASCDRFCLSWWAWGGGWVGKGGKRRRGRVSFFSLSRERSLFVRQLSLFLLCASLSLSLSLPRDHSHTCMAFCNASQPRRRSGGDTGRNELEKRAGKHEFFFLGGGLTSNKRRRL